MAAPDLTETAILTRLTSFLEAVLPAGVEVVQGQDNRVPEPVGPDFVVFWPINRARLGTNLGEYDPLDETKAVTTPVKFTVQVDVHGPNGADNAQVIMSLWRDPYGCEFMDPIAAPLYGEDFPQLPFANENDQLENRWVLRLHMQANISVSTPQEFADTLAITLVEVDTTYPPGAA